MKKFQWIVGILWIVALVAICGYLFDSFQEENAKREAELAAQHAEQERVAKSTKAAVLEMATRTNAVTDWEANLSQGETYRLGPILTVELERLWLQQRPILFTGSIKDIASHDQSRYMVVLVKGFFDSFRYMFATEIRLLLLSDKDAVDAFLAEHPYFFKEDGIHNGVAVVARINSIRTTYVLGEEGEREEIKIGDGELVDILYTGDVLF